MGQFQKLQKTIQEYRPLSHYILGIIVILPLYTTIKTYFLDTNSFLLSLYASFLSYIASGILNVLHQTDYVSLARESGNLLINSTLMTIWQTLLFVTGLFLLPFKLSKKSYYLIIGLLLIVFFNCTRIILIAFNAMHWRVFTTTLLNQFLVLLLNLAFIWLLMQWYKNHHRLKRLLLERIKISPEKLKLMVNRVIWALFVIVVINFITNTHFIPVVKYLVLGILKASAFLLNYWGYAASLVEERVIEGPIAGIYFSDSCLGLELIMTFALFIAILDGKLIHKIWYIAVGTTLIYIMNIARITLIYIHLVKNQGNYKLAINYHDIYSYSVYIVVFILWVIWINKFNRKVNSINENQ